MTIEKLPSGSYRISQTVGGKRYRVVIPYKPSKAEAKELIHDKIYGANSEIPIQNTVLDLAEKKIIKGRKDGLSPTTLSAYQSIIRNTPTWFLDIKINNVTAELFQKVVDEYAENHSAKSTKNLCGFYKAVFEQISHLKSATIKLPKSIKKAEYEPTTDDIERILEYVQGSEYECAINLACLGLRKGEICCITDADLSSKNVLTINKDKVYDHSSKTCIIKDHPKTEASNRRILIPSDVADMIRSQGYAYNGFPNNIYRYLQKVLKKLEIESFPLHMLRHFAAAKLHKSGFTDREIMAYLGWESASTLHRTYNYNLDAYENQKDIADVFARLKK